MPGSSQGGFSKPDPRFLKNLIANGLERPQGVTIADVPARTVLGPFGLLDPSKKTIVLNVRGQSNSVGAAVGEFYTVANSGKVFNLDCNTGALFVASEPLLGGGGMYSGTGGGAWSIRTADQLMSAAAADYCVIQTIGIGGTSASHWAEGGVLNHRITAAGQILRDLGFYGKSNVKILNLRHQGENDTYENTTYASYLASLTSEIATSQAILPGCPELIGLVSYFTGTQSANVRSAQNIKQDGTTGFSLGDFDVIGSGGRIGDIDYNGTGMAAAAVIAKDAILSYLSTHPFP